MKNRQSYPQSFVAKLLITEMSVVGGPTLIQQYRHLDQGSVTTVRAEELSCVANRPVERI